jgi:hypothetical protein
MNETLIGVFALICLVIFFILWKFGNKFNLPYKFEIEVLLFLFSLLIVVSAGYIQ